jgi:hypothetical protein
MEYIVNKKITLFILLSTYLFVASCSGQQQKEVSKKQNIMNATDSMESQIKEIRKEYARINSDSSKYKVVQKNINGESAEGGMLKKYFYGDKVQKATTIFFGETGKLTIEYYFKMGKVIFIYEKVDRYDTPIYNDKMKVKITKENRYYFNGQKLIRWIGDDGKIRDTQSYPAKEDEIFKDLKEIQ